MSHLVDVVITDDPVYLLAGLLIMGEYQPLFFYIVTTKELNLCRMGSKFNSLCSRGNPYIRQAMINILGTPICMYIFDFLLIS